MKFTAAGIKDLSLVYFLATLIVGFSVWTPSHAVYRASASSGSTGGGGTVPAATCAAPGGVIYNNGAAFTCNASFTTTGAGVVSASSSVNVGTPTVGLKLDGAGSAGLGIIQASTASIRLLGSGGTWNMPSSAMSYWIASNGVFGFGAATPETQDAGLSRIGAGVIALGNGTNGDTTGSIKGVITNSNAPALSIGEYLTGSVASASSSSISTGVATDGATVSLTAGDWEVSGVGCFTAGATTSVTAVQLGINQTSATQPALGDYVTVAYAAEVQGTANDLCITTPPTRQSLSGTTTLRLIATATFTVSTYRYYGLIRARRMR